MVEFDYSEEGDYVEGELSDKAKKKIRQKCKKLKSQGFKTPYRGPNKTFGQFYCFDCDNFWTSAHSWCDIGQQCRNCLEIVYPHTQIPPVRSKKKKGQPAHVTELCEKCKALGANCVSFSYASKKKSRKSRKRKSKAREE